LNNNTSGINWCSDSPYNNEYADYSRSKNKGSRRKKQKADTTFEKKKEETKPKSKMPATNCLLPLQKNFQSRFGSSGIKPQIVWTVRKILWSAGSRSHAEGRPAKHYWEAPDTAKQETEGAFVRQTGDPVSLVARSAQEAVAERANAE
jgi:hypothetical protein